MPGSSNPPKLLVTDTDLKMRQDRRRLGRTENASPALMDLLRDPTTIKISQVDGDSSEHFDVASLKPPHNDLDDARGIVRGVAIALPIWGFLALGIYWAVR